MTLVWLLADTAEEGRNVITIMLIVGLVFCSVVAIGNGLRDLNHRRRGWH
jgi:predicted membrane protein